VSQSPGEIRNAASAHLDALYTFALSLTRNPPDAEDLVQETCLRALRFAHRFEPGTHLRAWLFQILRNTFLTFYRRSARELLILDKEVPEDADEDWDVEGPRNPVETAVDLHRALADLPEAFRSVVLLADLHEFPLAQIGDIMDTPVGTVKSRLHRARRMLRRRLADYRTR
jgi:RNA polymerase sigma-70 factor (ECF subfamily)